MYACVCLCVCVRDNCTFKLRCRETDAILKQKARDAFRPQPKCTCVWQRWIFRPHLWACVFIIAQMKSLDFRPRAKYHISSSVLSERRGAQIPWTHAEDEWDHNVVYQCKSIPRQLTPCNEWVSFSHVMHSCLT